MKLFTGINCIPCQMVKDWLKQNNITEIEIVVANDNLDETKRLGIKSVPTLVLDDETCITGVNEIKDMILEKLNK